VLDLNGSRLDGMDLHRVASFVSIARLVATSAAEL